MFTFSTLFLKIWIFSSSSSCFPKILANDSGMVTYLCSQGYPYKQSRLKTRLWKVLRRTAFTRYTPVPATVAMRKLLKLLLCATQISLAPDRGNLHHPLHCIWDLLPMVPIMEKSLTAILVNRCMCVEVRDETFVTPLLSLTLPVIFKVSSLIWSLPIRLGSWQWPSGSEPQLSTQFYLLSTRVTDRVTTPGILHEFWKPTGPYAGMESTLPIEPSLQSGNLIELWINISGKPNMVVHLKPQQ